MNELPARLHASRIQHRGRCRAAWVGAAWIGLSCGAAAAQAARASILLVTLDTTRANRIGCYGYRRASTPNLDRLAQEGVRFDRCFTSAPLTLPAHGSLLTGLYPSYHGVLDNGGYILSEAHTTLTEVLRSQSYATAAFIGAYVLDSRWGLAQGFQRYGDEFDFSKFKTISLATVERPGNEVVDEALEWLGAARERPFFLWVHLYDPHHPYRPPPEFAAKVDGRPYDGEIAFADHQVGRLLERLKTSGALEQTLVVVVGDHGEGLGDHDEQTHGIFLYNSTMQVPWLMRLPQRRHAGTVVGTTVRTVDVAPTVLELLALPALGSIQGESAVALIGGPAPAQERPALAESYYSNFHFGWSDLKALVVGRYKLIDAPRPELFDLEADPIEAQNNSAVNAMLVERYRGMVADLLKDAPRPADAPRAVLDPEAEAQLRALGYLGGGTAAAAEGPLADPKEKRPVLQKLFKAEQLSDEGQIDASLATVKELLEIDQRVVDGHVLMGSLYNRKADYPQAIAAYQRALELKPDSILALQNLATTYRRAGRDAEAVPGFEQVLRLEPGNPSALWNLGRIAMQDGEFARAAELFGRGIESEADSPIFHGELASAWAQLERWPEAERAARTALRLKPKVPAAHFNLALAAEARGDRAAAVREYEAESRDFPDNHRSHFNLARLYAQSGRRADQVRELERAVEAKEDFAVGYLYLAKALIDLGDPARYGEVERHAQRGLELGPPAGQAPLGHFVLADLYQRTGRPELAQSALAQGQALARALQSKER